MDRARLFVAAACFHFPFAVPAAAAGAPDDEAFRARVVALAESTLKSAPIAGIAVGVLRGDETLFCGGFGLADVEQQVPATEHTFFRLASVSKQFTAAALLQLAEDGVVALDDPITKHLPSFRAAGGTITLLQLLNHTSGIPSLTALPDFRRRAPLVRTPDDVIAMFDGLPADFAPGTGLEYNNSAFVLAGEIAARAAGTTYAELIRTRLFEPLGMDESGYADETRLIPRRARGYKAEGGALVNADAFNMTVPGGAGALGSTASDLLKWARALPALEVVGDESFARMTAPTTIEGGITIPYGLGLALGLQDGAPWFGHGGNIEGFNTWIEWLPEQDAAVVVLVNTEGEQAEQLARRIARLLLPEQAEGASGAAKAPEPAAPLDATRAASCVGRYRSRNLDLEIVAAADGSLVAKLGPQTTGPLVFRGETAGRLEFEIDAQQRLHVEPEAKPPRATLTRAMAAQRFERN